MGILSKLFGKKEPVETEVTPFTPEKTAAIVELKEPILLAFDLPGEGAPYTIPDFSPGLYEVPLEAIKQHPDPDDGSPGIEVDTGAIFFIDAAFETVFREYEENYSEEIGDPYDIMDAPENFTQEVGIRFDCLLAPGIGSGYDFIGDGVYVLDVSLIRKVDAAGE